MTSKQNNGSFNTKTEEDSDQNSTKAIDQRRDSPLRRPQTGQQSQTKGIYPINLSTSTGVVKDDYLNDASKNVLS